MSKLRSGTAERIKLSGYNDLFGTNPEAEQIIDVPLSELHPFRNHPFKVLMNDEMEALVESIKQQGGVLSPGLVRKRQKGGYELISGHRRCKASELAGMVTMPVIVRELSDEEATVIMVDSNLQRENILPSERAFAYKMKYEALKRPGNQDGASAAKEMEENVGESVRQVQRYIRLTELIGPLLELVDQKRLGFVSGVDLSYLKKDEQEMLYNKMAELGAIPNGTQAAAIKKYSMSNGLTEEVADLILAGKNKTRKIILKQERISEYFPAGYTPEEIEDLIYKLLDKWKQGENNSDGILVKRSPYGGSDGDN